MKSYFHACIGLFGTAFLGAALLPACGDATCAAACASRTALTVTNADVTAHSYTITVQGSGITTVTVTCTVATGSTPASCTGGAFEATTGNGQIQLDIPGDPVPVDVTVTQDGTQVATAHLVPTTSTLDVCGETCAEGTTTLALP